MGSFEKGADIVLGDRSFGDYTTLAALPRGGVDGVDSLHRQSKVDFRKAELPPKRRRTVSLNQKLHAGSYSVSQTVAGRDNLVTPASSLAQSLCRRIGVFLVQISQQNLLSYTNPPRNRFAD